MNLQEVQEFIRQSSDTELELIAATVRSIQSIRNGGADLLFKYDLPRVILLHIGDKVRFNSEVHPRYMMGVEAVVTKVNRKRVVINIDTKGGQIDIGRFAPGKNVTCPPSLLEKI